MITLSDYQNQPGMIEDMTMFGSSSDMQDVDNLNKALEAGSTTGRETVNSTSLSGAPLKVESLDKTLKVLTFGESEAVLWKRIPKSAAYNTVEEYNQLTDYGVERGGFNKEGELPNEENSTYVRRAQLVKFMGVTKSVTHPMQLVNTQFGVGKMVEREIKNGTLWILRKLDKALYTGDSSLVTEEFNGLFTQHQKNDAYVDINAYLNSTAIVDCRGSFLQEKHIETAANSIVENFGLGTQIYAPPKVLSDFVKQFYGAKFIQPNTSALSEGRMGQRVKAFESQFGDIGLNYDIFMNPQPTKLIGSAATSTLAPNAPTVDATTPIAAVAATVPNSQWGSTDAGSYLYAVTAINRYGESGLSSFSGTPTAIVQNGAVALKFAPTASTNAATGFTIYRSRKGDATTAAAIYYPLFTVSLAELTAGYDGGAASIVRDLNRWMPDCYQATLWQENDEVLEFKQLAPLMKMDLAILSPAYRFMVLLYGTPFLYAVKKMVRFINIGRAT
jgi:hypothetical protein